MTLDRVLTLIVAIVLCLLIFSCERAKWRECRKYHPAWYCWSQRK